MNKLLLLFLTVFGYCLSPFSQNEVKTSTLTSDQDPYLTFRSEKMFFIHESTDQKILEYPLLTSISYFDSETKEEKVYTPEEFVTFFQNGEINNLTLNVRRDRFLELSYRIGNTGFLLIGRSEEQITSEFNQTIK